MEKKQIRGVMILVVVSILWGSCFAFQKRGMEYIGPYTLGVFRFLLGGLLLLPVIGIISKRKKTEEVVVNSRKVTIKAGILAGIVLFFAGSLQQIGLVYTTAGKAAFLTSMEIVFIGIISIVLTRKTEINTLLGGIIAVMGMYFLCVTQGLSMGFGDLLELCCGFFWALQLLVIDHYANQVDVIKMSFIQFMVAGILSVVGMVLFENPTVAGIVACAVPILYTAIVEVAICHTLQMVGQKNVPPVISAVILSMEAVFAVLFGAVILGEVIHIREMLGMGLMLFAVILMQFPSKVLQSQAAARD